MHCITINWKYSQKITMTWHDMTVVENYVWNEFLLYLPIPIAYLALFLYLLVYICRLFLLLLSFIFSFVLLSKCDRKVLQETIFVKKKNIVDAGAQFYILSLRCYFLLSFYLIFFFKNNSFLLTWRFFILTTIIP